MQSTKSTEIDRIDRHKKSTNAIKSMNLWKSTNATKSMLAYRHLFLFN